MNWIEIIEIRVLYRTREKLETELERILNEVNEQAGYPKLKIYSRINLETDFVILIMNSSGPEKSSANQIGLRLAEGLKDYGMVNYSKWNEFTAAVPQGDRLSNSTGAA